jgi:hypothetical protein
MSKVLVDPAVLEEAAKWLEVHSSSSGSAEAFAAEALREAIAQPAEAEGVEPVEFWVLFDATATKPFIKKMLPEGFLAFFDHEEDTIRAKTFHPGTDYKRVPYVRQSDHLAALSVERTRADVAVADANDAERQLAAVTAERDAALASLERAYANYNQVSYASTERGKQIDQLRAEVERWKIHASNWESVAHKQDRRLKDILRGLASDKALSVFQAPCDIELLPVPCEVIRDDDVLLVIHQRDAALAAKEA